MENQEQSSEIFFWETRFFAICQLSGDMTGYRGLFIKAETLQHAMTAIRKMDFPYLFLTGNWFKSLEAIQKNDNFHNPIDNNTLDIKSMSYDEFCDWLDNSLTVDDLLKAKDIVKTTVKASKEFINERLKVIDVYIKRKNEENN